MPDREKVIRALEVCSRITNDMRCPHGCPYMQHGSICYGTNGLMQDALALLREQEAVAAKQRDKFMRSWETIKFSVVDTANNNAGPGGNPEIFRILKFVARMMDSQEKGW